MQSFNERSVLSYLSLPDDYEPSPSNSPIDFLSKHLRQLPPNILEHFSSITTPKQRTVIPTIRNRRLKYTRSNPPELTLTAAKTKWPMLWTGRERRGLQEGLDEKNWADHEFLAGGKKHVGKLGDLLRDYEEEREGEKSRELRRRQALQVDSVPEEEEDSDDEVELLVEEQESIEELESSFERIIGENFIYGLLDSADYDCVDWEDSWDNDDDREAQERWFDEEEEEDMVMD